MRTRLARFTALVAALASTASCTALIDLDQYELATCTELRLDLISFAGPHSTVPVEVRAADDMNRLSCLVRLVPFGSEDNLAIRVPHCLTTPASHIDFYADINGNGIADAPANMGGIDHSWTIEEDFVCADQDPTVFNAFTHDFNFVAINEVDGFFPISNEDAALVIQGVDDPLETFELRITALIPGGAGEPAALQTVGVFRRPKVGAGDPRETETEFPVRLPGILDPGTSYRIELWNDADGDGAYDAPDTDQAWSVEVTAGQISCATGDTDPGTCMPFVIDTDDTLAFPESDIGGIYVTVLP